MQLSPFSLSPSFSNSPSLSVLLFSLHLWPLLPLSRHRVRRQRCSLKLFFFFISCGSAFLSVTFLFFISFSADLKFCSLAAWCCYWRSTPSLVIAGLVTQTPGNLYICHGCFLHDLFFTLSLVSHQADTLLHIVSPLTHTHKHTHLSHVNTVPKNTDAIELLLMPSCVACQ